MWYVPTFIFNRDGIRMQLFLLYRLYVYYNLYSISIVYNVLFLL